MIGGRPHNHRREAFLRAQREAERKREERRTRGLVTLAEARNLLRMPALHATPQNLHS